MNLSTTPIRKPGFSARSSLLQVLSALWLVPALLGDSFPPPRWLGDTNAHGRSIQRTMALLATSTPEKRNTVRILFYGQSITEQKWWQAVADDLRRQFPNANLVIENRAIGGHSSQLLVKTAEADLYPFYPDLLIFHVYGSHVDYESILRRVRERTTAEILMQTDHITKDEDLNEETDPAKLTPKQWNAWMNHAFLPSTAARYGAELCDQHTIWKHYLREFNLPPSALLSDGVHLNDHGCFLMAECVKAYLRYDSSWPTNDWSDRVKTFTVGREIHWQDGRLKLEFEGNRVDVVVAKGSAAPARVLIDGRKPSEFPELYGFTRTTAFPNSNWPMLLRVSSEKPLVAEDWTLTLHGSPTNAQSVSFEIVGSKTGPDGEGRAGQRFVSRSGRVVIEPGDWNLDYCLKVFQRPLPADFQVQWKALFRGTDEFISPGVSDPTLEATVTLAQGLANTKHQVEITGDAGTPIAAVRVYRPPLPP
jgi:hypothetical protein